MELLEEMPLLSLSLLRNPVCLATATAITSLYIYFMCPRLLVQMYFRICVRWSGMRLKSVTGADGFTFTFGERGQPAQGRPTILLFHGFTADHFMWAPIVQHFAASVHMVALDLPGHGFTSDPVKGETINFMGQLKRIRKFVSLTGLDRRRVHVVGVSMGGALAGLYAARYPELVSAVTMCCPSMKTPQDAEMITKNQEKVLQNGGRMTLDTCPLLPQTGVALQSMLQVVSYRPSYVPSQILQGAVDLRKARNEFYLDLVHELVSEESRFMLESHLQDITCPAQVIWGQEDAVVHVSGVETLKAKLPDLRCVDIMPHCGHAVNLDQPRLFASCLMEFCAQLQKETAT